MDSLEAKGCFFVSIIAAVTLSPIACFGCSVWYYTHDKMPTAIFWLLRWRSRGTWWDECGVRYSLNHDIFA
jgi:hypothetical protein